jgi:hypothetical protein
MSVFLYVCLSLGLSVSLSWNGLKIRPVFFNLGFAKKKVDDFNVLGEMGKNAEEVYEMTEVSY